MGSTGGRGSRDNRDSRDARDENPAGIIFEGACACFRERLADSVCVLSPSYPAWCGALEEAGLLDPESHREASPADDTEWIEVQTVGSVFRRRDGSALLVSPMPVSDG